MGQASRLKRHLPFPYSQDLSTILRRLNRRRPGSRAKLANDVTTASYLAAGMRLIQRNLGPQREGNCEGAERCHVGPRSLLSFLSQRAVSAEVGNNTSPFLRQGSVSALRSSWHSQSDYIADLLSFGLWYLHRPAAARPELMDIAEKLTSGDRLTETIHSLCYEDLDSMVKSSSFRLRLVAAIISEEDEVIREALNSADDVNLENWMSIYAKSLLAHGLSLRSDMSLREFTETLMAMAMGFAVRVVGDPHTDIIDHRRKKTLFGKAALGFILGCVEPAQDGRTHGSVENLVISMICGPLGGADCA
jgi:hypothetical protein